MLTNVWHILSNSGIKDTLPPATARSIILTNRFGVISALITLIILLALLVGIPEGGWSNSRLLILACAFLFFSVVSFNRFGYYELSKWMISWLPTLLIIYTSIYDKMNLVEFITIKDFFIYRFLLMSTTIIPILIFSTTKIKTMLINLFPSFIGTVFFERIHDQFGVSFIQFGFKDPYFFILDISIALSYFGMAGFLLNQRFVTDRFERKISLQKSSLEEKNRELSHKNHFINEQNHEVSAQADQLKEANQALSKANEIIENQKRLLEGQNHNLARQVAKKTKVLSKVNEELVMYNSELRQFSHTLSHNLKSPVATFQGLLNLVDEDDLNPANNELLRYLRDSVLKMQGVFDDMNQMLELRNQLYTSTQKVDLQKQIDSLHSHFYPELRRNSIGFRCECNGTKKIKSNEKRLNDILYQLISNSIKFRSDQRPPEICLTLNGNDKHHSIRVWDNGMGIDLKRYQKKVFYPYQKFHRGIAGKGLGLYLVKLQTEALGGKVSIKSVPDEFTEVEILLQKQDYS